MNNELKQHIIEIKARFYDVFASCLVGEISLNDLMLVFNDVTKQINDAIYDYYMAEEFNKEKNKETELEYEEEIPW